MKREHQLSAGPLAEWMLGDEAVQLGGHVVVPAEREIGLDPLLDCREPELLEPRDLALRERVVGEVRQRWAAPDLERFAQRRLGLLGLPCGQGAPAVLEQPLEAVGVELARRHLEGIAVRLRPQDAFLSTRPRAPSVAARCGPGRS